MMAEIKNISRDKMRNILVREYIDSLIEEDKEKYISTFGVRQLNEKYQGQRLFSELETIIKRINKCTFSINSPQILSFNPEKPPRDYAVALGWMEYACLPTKQTNDGKFRFMLQITDAGRDIVKGYRTSLNYQNIEKRIEEYKLQTLNQLSF